MGKATESGSRKRKKLALGRGFDALIPNIGTVEAQFKGYRQCEISLIRPNRYQPRIRFRKEEMEELCRSVEAHGILQPLLVRKADAGFELIAGERRLRAAKMAGMSEVPVVVKDISEAEVIEISIIENIQREDLNPMEEADAYYRLLDEFKLTQEQVAKRVGKSRPAVANFLRLRQLPAKIKESIRQQELSMGHARALLGADTPAQQTAAWRSVVARRLSVRETEALISRLKSRVGKSGKKPPTSEDLYFVDLSEELSRNFGTRVRIKKRGRKGRVEIEFYSDEDLDRLIGLLKRG